MTLQELVLLNKGKYDYLYIAKSGEGKLVDSSLELIREESLLGDNIEVIDYFLLDEEGMVDIFKKAGDLDLKNKLSLVAIIG